MNKRPRQPITAEARRLLEHQSGEADWQRWGPYLSERQWGTVREDYSEGGAAWDSFPHNHARSRAYRWGEDGLAGLSDKKQRLCLALGLWNGKDPILKERLFGLTNGEGNHGEDVKELYYYLDATPTHTYLKFLYKYPQAEYPYARLMNVNRQRGMGAPEFELLDSGVFDQDRYFDVYVEYAKAGPEDILMRISVHNRGDQAATLHLLPQLWFRNTWSWVAMRSVPSFPPPNFAPSACATASSGSTTGMPRVRPSSCSATTTPTCAASPVGSGKHLNLLQVAEELSRRLTRLFLRDGEGRRAVFGDADKHQHDPHFRHYLLFYEYFHGDSGRGVGAAHQTGLVANLIHELHAVPDKARQGRRLASKTGITELG